MTQSLQDTLIRRLLHWTVDKRRSLFSALRTVFCLDCGNLAKDKNGLRCQCWNDE
jgi:hypothetical protein